MDDEANIKAYICTVFAKIWCKGEVEIGYGR